MLKIKNLYKKQTNSFINDINLMVEKGSLVRIEADRELSNTLIDLILDKEVMGSGEIYIDQIKHSDYIHKNKGNIGVIFRDEGFYERFTVEEYMRYYTEIIDSKVNYRGEGEKYPKNFNACSSFSTGIFVYAYKKKRLD
ncbi:hypothetical protein OD350_22605 [Clostridium beijerinckii]|uniref:hypothetical protein n=1 Tax=Clostridium beijerinckii TaxID=1520 RepID=UPI002226E5B5|nr:hypothetical protein [Clostridium beijerinckii]UYZ35006.1 hypothetical protein OD350_22605 [Clostridium beijerinckii]